MKKNKVIIIDPHFILEYNTVFVELAEAVRFFEQT